MLPQHSLLAAARKAAAATPAGRDRYVDFLRVASLLVVVLGHWLMTLLSWSGGRLEGGNVLALVPGLWLATWVLQVMPVFFVVGGFSNMVTWEAIQRRGGGYVEYLTGRMARLLRPVLAFALAWLAIPPLLVLAGLPGEGLAQAGKLMAQPLWFLGVYLVAVALAPVMVRLHRRHGLRVPAVLAAGAAAVDALRLGAGLEALGYLNVLLVWVLVQQLGFFYADGSLARCPRRALAAVGGASLGALAVLTGSGLYPGSMVGLPGAPVSNMNPPTVCIIALAVWQVALLELARERAARWLARPRPWTAVVLVGSMIMTLYLWHLTALLAVVGALAALGVPLPEPATAGWWATRPLWLVLLLLALAPIALAFARFERPARLAPPPPGAERGDGRLAAVLGLVLAALGLLGLVMSGFSPAVNPEGSLLLALRTDPLQSLLHLLLGVYLAGAARRGAAAGRWPWAVTAAASALPLLPALPGGGVVPLATSPVGLAFHAGVLAVAVAMAVRRPRRTGLPAPAGSA